MKNARSKAPTRKARVANPKHLLEEAAAALADLDANDRHGGGIASRGLGQIAALESEAENRSRASSLVALRDLASSLTAGLDLHALVKQILHGTVQALGAERGILFLGRGLEAPLIPVFAVDVEGEELQTLGQVSRTILQRAHTGELFMTPDAMADPALREVPSVRLKKIRSVICAPITVRNEVTGVLYLDSLRAADAFPPGAKELLSACAAIAAAALGNARLHGELRRANTYLRTKLDAEQRFSELPSLNPAMDDLKHRIALAAQIEAPVLLLGETGTEIERMARAIHAAGPRSLQPFVAYDCAAGPRNLMAEEIFGRARKANVESWSRLGLFREAERGVLFLNEITALDAGLQEKLVRVLEERVVQPVRSREEFPINVQLVTATSRDPKAEVRAGRFRRDLLYRLNVVEISIPPLRERPEDVPALVEHYLREHAEGLESPPRVTFTSEALEYLERRPWPGNLTQLEWLVRRVLSRGKPGPIDTEIVRSLLAAWEGAGESQTGIGHRTAKGPFDPVRNLRSFAEVERDLIRDALIRTQGNRSKTARLLGVQRNTLLRRIAHLGVSLDGIPNRRGRK